MHKNGLRIFAICFLVNACSSCKKFNWEPKPYAGDSKEMHLINAKGEIIRCDQPAFDKMTAFDEENIAELKTAIDQINNRKLRRELHKKLDRIYYR